MRELYYSHALREALVEEMDRDERVFLIGEDVGVYGGAFKVTQGLLERYGPARVRDTPISENGIIGVAAGAALLGMRPVAEIMFMDFITLAMDQIVNHAAKFFYMYGRQRPVPLVIRTPAGGGRSYGPTHSQSLEAWFLHAPGLKVVCPASASDAKGLLKTAIRDDNPVLFVESKLLYGQKGAVPEGDYTVPFGQARLVRPGAHVTVITYSRMVNEAEAAAQALARQGVEVEVVDLRTLVPLDLATICESVARTSRVVLVEEGTRTGGVGAELAARIMEESFYDLDAPIVRLAGADVPIPCSPKLEQAVLPDRNAIAQAIVKLLEM